MKLTIGRDALARTLAFVQGAVQRKTTAPILSNVRIEASNGNVILRATDLDIEASAHAPAEAIAEAGACAASAATLGEFVRKLAAGSTVNLDIVAGELVVTSARARLSIPTLPVEDFPNFPPMAADAARFNLDAAALRRLIDCTRAAISTEQARYYLCGMFLHAREIAPGEHRLAAACTDGHRLAYADTEAPAAAHGFAGAIIPRATVNEIRKLIADVEGDVSIALTRHAIAVETSEATVASKTIDGSFPEYQRIIPTRHPAAVKVARDALSDALARVMIVSPERSHSVRLSALQDTLTIRARDLDHGEAIEDLAAEGDAEMEIGFNGKYLTDALAQSDAADVEIRLTDGQSPSTIADTEDAHAFTVLMPLRV